MHRNRRTFLLLRELVPQLIVISDAGRGGREKLKLYVTSADRGWHEGVSPEEKTEVPAGQRSSPRAEFL